MSNLEVIKQKIIDNHLNDVDQTSIVFDNGDRIIVEAPAGCGKTKTMISKIAYILASNQIESTKKILALTFSVNASYKIKKDVLEQLPNINNCTESESLKLTDKITVSNYHGFCRRLLSKYGYLVTNKTINFNTIVAISDNKQVLGHYGVDEDKINYLMDFSSKIKNNDYKYIEENYGDYNSYIKIYLLPHGAITYDGILLLAYELLKTNHNLKNFYQKIYPIIFIDEFQDTNCISWMIIKQLISEQSKLIFMGDSLQRIYGFIGAVPKLMNIAEKELNMRKFVLKTNYRFKNNQDMLYLDNNIRLNAKNFNNDMIKTISNPNIILADNQALECNWICDKINEIKDNRKVAILTRIGMGSQNTKTIKETMDSKGIKYFFALFTDEDPDYIEFHAQALKIFDDLIVVKNTITTKLVNKYIDKMNSIYQNGNNIHISLLKLLKVSLEKLFDEYRLFSVDEKIKLIHETLENKALRQGMDKIEDNVVLTTIHASKGLEFTNVIIADTEENNIPSWFTCIKCNDINKNAYCVKKVANNSDVSFLEELSVFYVGFTRARETVYFTSSKIDAQGDVKKASCFLKLKGIGKENLIRITEKNDFTL